MTCKQANKFCNKKTRKNLRKFDTIYIDIMQGSHKLFSAFLEMDIECRTKHSLPTSILENISNNELVSILLSKKFLLSRK